MAHKLPDLPYAANALEPTIDTQTMQIHQGKHHAAYVNNLNAALEKYPDLQAKSVEDLIADLNAIPADIRAAVRNNGGGHVNHTLFWQWMKPGGSQPSKEFTDLIGGTFGSLDGFKEQFAKAALGRFGSGWTWLCAGAGKKLFIASTPNQDNPLMKGIAEQPGAPLLGLDVWEHAYYLKYQNRRADYISAWWNVVNWAQVEELFAKAK